MSKRRLFCLGFAACLGLAVFWGVRLVTPSNRINWGSFEKIQMGMTLEEVEGLLGVPPGDYSTRPFYCLDRPTIIIVPHKQWIGDEGKIWVGIDKERKVTWHRWIQNYFKREENFVDKLSRWLGFKDETKSWDSIPMPPDW